MRPVGVRSRSKARGSYGAGLTRFLTATASRCSRSAVCRGSGVGSGKTDALDAVRAARSVLAQKRPATPRTNGEREALRALMAAREGAVNAKRAGLCQLRDLLVTTPEPLRSELRPLSRAQLLERLRQPGRHAATTRSCAAPCSRSAPSLAASGS